MPLTIDLALLEGSSALTVLIRVDLPEPDGPQTTTTSPLWMVTEQSFSTCTGPYHLETFLILIMFRDGQQGPPRSKGSRLQRTMAIFAFCRRLTDQDSA
jgi:hypothetical protein